MNSQGTARHGSKFIARQFGKYKLFEKIGHGGMAEIFKAVAVGAQDFKKVLVVKKILMPYSRDPNFVKMFVEEAKVCAPLQHPNIVSILEFDEVDGQYYLAMEYVHGRDFQRVMARCNKLGRCIPVDICLHVVGEVCKALDYAHNAMDPHGRPLNIVHMDVSPSNILVSYEGDVKVTDFGVAKAASTRNSGSGMLKGKLGYMSPERILDKQVDHRADLFSLAIILFEAITLKRLFLGRTDLQTLINVRDANVERRLRKHPEIPKEVQDILRKGLAREPRDRYQTADEILSDIQEYMYRHKMRVSRKDVAALMKELFPQEAEAEILPLEFEELTETSPAGVGPSTEVLTDVVEERRGEERSDGEIPIDREEGLGPTKATRISPAKSQFMIKDAEGNIFGPISFANLLSLLKSRAMTEDELVSVNEGPWVRVREVGCIQDHIGEVQSELAQRSLLMEGSIDQQKTLALLYDVCIKKRITGVLTFKKGSARKEVFLKKGQPRVIFSNLKHEILAEFLVARGVVTREQLKEVMRWAIEQQLEVGDALVVKGLVRAHELADLLQWQFRERFLDLFKWERGWFGVFEQAQLPRGQVSFDLAPLPAMAEAARKVVPMETIRAFFADQSGRTIVRARQPIVSVSDFRPTPKEMRVVHLLDSLGSIEAVTHEMGRLYQGEEVALRIAFLLLHTEVFAFKGV